MLYFYSPLGGKIGNMLHSHASTDSKKSWSVMTLCPDTSSCTVVYCVIPDFILINTLYYTVPHRKYMLYGVIPDSAKNATLYTTADMYTVVYSV